MSMKQTLGECINRILRPMGYTLRRNDAWHDFSMAKGLARLASRNLPIQTIIDVGASNGCWTRLAQQSFPDTHYLLIEANKVHEPELKAFRDAQAKVDFVLAAASDQPGEVYFDDRDPDGGLASKACGENSKPTPATSIDHEIASRELPVGYLIKLDTHGYELPILAGAEKTLSQTQALIIEAYNFQLTDNSLRFHELVAWLEERGFRVADLVDVAHRPKDQLLWQMDLFFVRNNLPGFASNTHR